MEYYRKQVLQTLIYSDLFNYPLTKKELWYYLKSKKPIHKGDFNKALNSLKDIIVQKRGFFSFADRESIIERRISLQYENRKKIALAKKIANILSNIPTIQFIGISGSLAAKNAERDDDIDFFIIASKKTLWISRFLMLILLEFLGVRRKKNQHNESNTVCINMMIDENSCVFPKNRQDVYTAHELAQLYPLVDKKHIYRKLLQENAWIYAFMPNVKEKRLFYQKRVSLVKNLFMVSVLPAFYLLNLFLKKIQLFSIRKTLTTEVVTDAFLAFHPFDYRKSVLNHYSNKLKKYQI